MLQDTLRRVSAEAQREAQRCSADGGHPTLSKVKLKKRNWFLQLFKASGSGKLGNNVSKSCL